MPNIEYTAAEIRKILEGPHEYKNGQYVPVQSEPIQETKKSTIVDILVETAPKAKK